MCYYTSKGSDYVKLNKRTEKSSKVREQGFIPGVMYSAGFDTVSVQMPNNDFKQALFKYGLTKSFEVSLDGKKHTVYIREAQSEITNQHTYIHFDLMKVSKGDTLHANVSLHFQNKESLPSSLVLAIVMDELPIEYNVGSGVAYIDVDLTNLSEDKPLYVKDIVLPKGIKAHVDPNEMVCNLVSGSKAELPEETEAVVETTEYVE